MLTINNDNVKFEFKIWSLFLYSFEFLIKGKRNVELTSKVELIEIEADKRNNSYNEKREETHAKLRVQSMGHWTLLT